MTTVKLIETVYQEPVGIVQLRFAFLPSQRKGGGLS